MVLSLICILLSMCGCSVFHSQKPNIRVVTSVDVSCRQKDRQISRHYETFEKMEAVLLYIRLAGNGRVPQNDPETVDADTWRICLRLSDGQQRIYRQKDHRYFYRPQKGWQTLDPNHAAKLYRLLRQYQSDPPIQI